MSDPVGLDAREVARRGPNGGAGRGHGGSIASWIVVIAAAALDLAWLRNTLIEARSIFGHSSYRVDLGLIPIANASILGAAHLAHRRGQASPFVAGFAAVAAAESAIYAAYGVAFPGQLNSMARHALWFSMRMGRPGWLVRALDSLTPVGSPDLYNMVFLSAYFAVPLLLIASSGGAAASWAAREATRRR